MGNLDTKSRSLLEKDPGNPNANTAGPASSGDQPATGPQPAAKKTPGKPAPAGRSALKAAIAAQKKKQALPKATPPHRPETAQSAFHDDKLVDPKTTEIEQTNGNNTTDKNTFEENVTERKASQALASDTKAAPAKASGVRNLSSRPQIASLSSAPVRPVKRPELARPATAEPITSRKPRNLGSRAITPKADDSPPAEAPSPRQPSTTIKPKKLDISKTPHVHVDVSPVPDQQSPVPAPVSSEPTESVPVAQEERSNTPVKLENPSPPASPATTVVHHPLAEVRSLNATPVPTKAQQNVSGLSVAPSHQPSHYQRKHFKCPAPPSWYEVSDNPSRRRWRKIEATEKRRSVSPLSKDPEHARQFIRSSTDRINNGTMDVLTYRKLQGIVEHHDEMFHDEDLFAVLLQALLEELQRRPSTGTPALGRPHDLKTQTLLTIRFMFWHCKLYFASYYHMAMPALLGARRWYEPSCHVASGLEDTAEDIARVCNAVGAAETTTQAITTEQRDAAGWHVICMGLHCLAIMMWRFNKDVRKIPADIVDSPAKFLNIVFAGEEPAARHEGLGISRQFRALIGDDNRLKKLIGTVRGDAGSLLDYYVFMRTVEISPLWT